MRPALKRRARTSVRLAILTPLILSRRAHGSPELPQAPGANVRSLGFPRCAPGAHLRLPASRWKPLHRLAGGANTRPGRRVIHDDFAPEKPPNPLKRNGSEKRWIYRQKSSKVVKIWLNPLISLNNV